MTPLINGINYHWATIKVVLFGIPVVGITKIEYKIKQKKENQYGAGYEPISRGYGNKEYEGSIEIYTEELKRIINSAPNRDILSIPPFQITVLFENELGVLIGQDQLLMCEFMEEGLSASQGDTKILTSLPLVIGQIRR
jgi:hypothetical protein